MGTWLSTITFYFLSTTSTHKLATRYAILCGGGASLTRHRPNIQTRQTRARSIPPSQDQPRWEGARDGMRRSSRLVKCEITKNKNKNLNTRRASAHAASGRFSMLHHECKLTRVTLRRFWMGTTGTSLVDSPVPVGGWVDATEGASSLGESAS